LDLLAVVCSFIMRVKCKYGEGILLGITTNDGEFVGYKVLVDYDEVFEKLEDRIYHCLSVTVKTDDDYEVELGNGVITVL